MFKDPLWRHELRNARAYLLSAWEQVGEGPQSIIISKAIKCIDAALSGGPVPSFPNSERAPGPYREFDGKLKIGRYMIQDRHAFWLSVEEVLDIMNRPPRG